jgi:hypothetical protein
MANNKRPRLERQDTSLTESSDSITTTQEYPESKKDPVIEWLKENLPIYLDAAMIKLTKMVAEDVEKVDKVTFVLKK